MDDDYTERVRRRAYQIWLEEGRPEGREDIHWEMARELVAIEDGQTATLKPVRRASADPELAVDTIEPAAPAANMGELPTTTDAGEQTYPPDRAAATGKAGSQQPAPAAAEPKAAEAKAPPAKPAGAKSPPAKSPPATKAPPSPPRGKK